MAYINTITPKLIFLGNKNHKYIYQEYYSGVKYILAITLWRIGENNMTFSLLVGSNLQTNG